MGDPALSLTYKCTIDGIIPLGTWSKIEGLGFSYQVTQYREGGVNTHMRNIIGPVTYERRPPVPTRSTRIPSSSTSG